MKVTIKDIARELNLSAAAVSKALNDKPDISIEMKQKVKLKSIEMNYKKNKMTAKLVSKKSNTIGVFIFGRGKLKTEENSTFKFIEVYLNEAKHRAYDLLLFSIDDELSDKSMLHLCLEKNIEGIIIIGAQQNQRNIQEIIDYPIPTIFVETRILGEKTSYIAFSNEAAIEKSMDYLVKSGHKKIAFVKGTLQTDVTREIFSTYVKKISDISEYEETYIFQENLGFEIAKKLKELSDKPTAVLVSDELSAVDLIRGLNSYGISVPNDISVIVYDGFEVKHLIEPHLTTIKKDFFTMAKQTILMLFKIIDEKNNIEPIILNVDLIERESVKNISYSHM